MIHSVKKYLLGVLAAYAVILLCACFWPFNFFQKNLVRVESGEISFSTPGMAYTSGTVGLEDLMEFTIVAELIAGSPGQSSWIVSYGTDFEELNFLVGIYVNHLIVETRRGSQTMRASIEGALPRDQRTWLVVAGTPGSLKIYIDGRLRREVVRTVPDSSRWASGYPLVMGARSDGKYPWQGKLFAFAVLDRACTDEQAAAPEVLASSVSSVKYEFTRVSDRKVLNSGTGEAGPLYIPEDFVPYRRAALMDLGDTWTPRPLWGDIVLNILAFVPLGALLSFFLSKSFHPVKVVLLVLLAGFGLSLCVEMLQVYLPRRWSTFMDVATNSVGALFGSVSWFLGIDRFFRAKFSRAAMSPLESKQDIHP